MVTRFSALQRAEIAEMLARRGRILAQNAVSVLFNEPKLLKYVADRREHRVVCGFSALQRAEIAEIHRARPAVLAFASVSVLFNEPKLLKFTV